MLDKVTPTFLELMAEAQATRLQANEKLLPVRHVKVEDFVSTPKDKPKKADQVTLRMKVMKIIYRLLAPRPSKPK